MEWLKWFLVILAADVCASLLKESNWKRLFKKKRKRSRSRKVAQIIPLKKVD